MSKVIFTHIHIENFCNHKEFDADLFDKTLVSGHNKAGKSTIRNAIKREMRITFLFMPNLFTCVHHLSFIISEFFSCCNTNIKPTPNETIVSIRVG